jgi:hypothetical protein
MANEGGIMRTAFKNGGDWTRRKFLQFIGGAAALPIVGKYFKAAKLAKPAATAASTIIKGADGMPAYLTDLITVVKAKGTKDIIEGFKKSDYSTVHSYKGVDVVEDAAGNTRIKKGKETSVYGHDEPAYHETHMEIIPGEYIQKGSTVSDEAAKTVKTSDEYFEGTVRPDMDGKMKDFVEGIDELDHLELKKIADEIDTLVIKKSKKASGGLAYMLGE